MKKFLKLMHYDPDANIIGIELASGEIESARDFGNFIVHFSPAGQPVYLEILEADKLAKQFNKNKAVKKAEEIATAF